MPRHPDRSSERMGPSLSRRLALRAGLLAVVGYKVAETTAVAEGASAAYFIANAPRPDLAARHGRRLNLGNIVRQVSEESAIVWGVGDSTAVGWTDSGWTL